MSGNAPAKNNLLEIEDEITRQERLGRLFAAQSSTPNASTTAVPNERKTYAVPPPNDLLSRLEAFLPAMKEANEALARKASAEGTESVDIAAVEEVSSGSEAGSEDSDDEDSQLQDGEDEPSPPRKPYIRMNLGLGVFEQRPYAEGNRAHAATGDLHIPDEDPSSSSSSDSASESSESVISPTETSKAL